MQKFIIEADVDDAALLALLQIILPGKTNIKRLVTCEVQILARTSKKR